MTHLRLFRRLPLAPMLAVVMLLSACGQRDAPPQGTAASVTSTTPVAGGELVFAFDGAGTSQFPLDPHRSAYAPHHRIMRSIFDSLVVALPGHRFGPWLATSWQISADGKSTTFELRHDVSFHDGTRFDAKAVKVNLDRILDPKNALFAAGDLGSLQSVSVVGEFMVRLDFATPFAPLLAQLSKTNFGMISPAALATYGDQIPAHPVGTGPFRLVSIAPGTEVVLDRFGPYRWAPAGSTNPGAARLDRIVFKNVPEEATRVAVLENGQAQAADLIPPQNLVQFRQRKEFGLLTGELLNHNYSLFLNLTREPWTDARVRLAFRQSLDLDAAVKTIYLGTAARAWSPLSPSVFGYDKTLEGSWKPDRAAARASFDALGWKVGTDGIRVKNGKRLTVVFLDSQGNREKRLDLVTFLRRQLRDAGVEVRIDSQPGGSFIEKVKAGGYDLVGASQFSPDPDVLRRLYSPVGRAAASSLKTNDAELNAWLDAGSRQTDDAARLPLYAKAQRRIVEETYGIPVYVLIYNVAHSSRVRDITLDLHGFPQFQEAWLPQP